MSPQHPTFQRNTSRSAYRQQNVKQRSNLCKITVRGRRGFSSKFLIEMQMTGIVQGMVRMLIPLSDLIGCAQYPEEIFQGGSAPCPRCLCRIQWRLPDNDARSAGKGRTAARSIWGNRLTGGSPGLDNLFRTYRSRCTGR